MSKTLLSIDWDYFIPIKEKWVCSNFENKKNIIDIWYKRYFKAQKNGFNLDKIITCSPKTKLFWTVIQKYFYLKDNIKFVISDSHKFSYTLAKKYCCSQVINFDAHSDLGYGGIKSLNFELNCSNWLGKLLNNDIIDKAVIIYSPFTHEHIKDFNEINESFNILYPKINEIHQKIPISVLHICRSGAWTPPWLDTTFKKFIKKPSLPYKVIDCPKRIWNINSLNLSDKLNYLLCS